MASFLHSAGWLVALLFLLSCHDAPRNNPFDPALTPPVELQVALDDTAGIATLTWTPYQGQQPFAEYRVLRNIADRTRVDTLAHIPALADTAFVDTSLAPNTAYVYRVEVVNAAGYETPSEEQSVAGFSVGTVRLLGVESDPQAGTLTLRWNRYVGPDFAGYQLHRRVVGTDREEILAQIPVPTDTAFADSTAQAGVEYVYTVVVEAAGQTLLSNTQETKLILPPVAITRADFNSADASASLKWTRYQGPRFKAYRVERRTAGLTPLVVQELTSTSYVDTGLAGNTEYFYKIVVVTTRDEEVPSEEQHGAFHQLLSTWPLEMEEGEYVRLYWEGDHLTALVAGKQRVRLFFFDAQGALLEEQGLLDRPPQVIEPRSVATYLSPEGRRYVSAAFAGIVAVLGFGADGQPLYQEHLFFADSLSALSSGPYATVRKRVAIHGGLGFFFDQVEVSANGQVLFEEDFEGEPEDWDVIDKNRMVEGRYNAFAGKSDEAWQDFYLEAEVLFEKQGAGSIAIGTLEEINTSLFRFYLQPVAQQVQLSWTFRPGPTSTLTRQSGLFTEPFSLIPGPPYRIGLGFREGQFSASVSSPLLWSGAREGRAPWASLAGLEEKLLLVSGSRPYRISPAEREAEPIASTLDPPPSEMRIWGNKSTGNTRPWIGICLPERQQVLIGFTGIQVATGRLIWPSFNSASATALGAEIGQGEGAFLYPLSFDGSPDGRIYVLDAGNGRIQVFDVEGKYLTQWGHKGSSEGEFDFGSGRVPEDFAGSVAVDNEGYIYVADVGNRRIQKFAP